jgi:hypothetical protein
MRNFFEAVPRTRANAFNPTYGFCFGNWLRTDCRRHSCVENGANLVSSASWPPSAKKRITLSQAFSPPSSHKREQALGQDDPSAWPLHLPSRAARRDASGCYQTDDRAALNAYRQVCCGPGGNRNVKAAPPPGLSDMETVPCRAVMMCLTIASPKPAPLPLRSPFQNRSKI